MNGLMQQQQLLISNLLVLAERHHGEQQIVSRRVEGDIHRYTYRELAERSRRAAIAINALGVNFGDRVGTLARNGYRHMELYYGLSGSGYSLSKETGDVATFVKLMRVAMLVPVIVFAVMLVRMRNREAGASTGPRPPLLPWFAVGFALLVAINSTGWLPQALTQAGSEFSRWCLVASIAGIGMKTQLKELVTVGIRPVLLMIGETAFLVVLVIALLHWTR